MGLTFELRDVKNIVSDKPFVLIANHQTIIDVLGKDFKNKINISWFFVSVNQLMCVQQL